MALCVILIYDMANAAHRLTVRQNGTGGDWMKWRSLEEESCSIARTLAVIGDRWSLLILRDCFLRVRRFEEFQSRLAITRALLADRLKKLVSFGVLRRAPYQMSPKRHEYILTQKGLELYPILMAIVHWGDVHMVDERGRPLLHNHKLCGKLFDPVMCCSECGKPLNAKEVHTHPGPGAREASAPAPAKVPHGKSSARKPARA
jgi:DNA-binding HxlR family transcriptional regulator